VCFSAVEVCVFVCKDLHVKKIGNSRNCKEKYLEICAVELETESSKFIILSLNRVPTGDFSKFGKNPEDTLKYLYKPKAEFLIRGGISTYYLTESN
jgi:hypothetical protein